MYVIRRILQAIPVMLVVSILAFLILAVIPGDPAAVMAGTSATTEDIQRVRDSLGLDEPLPVRYIKFMRGVFDPEAVRSFRTRRPVATELAERLPNTLKLAFGALLFGIIVGVPTGIVSAVRQGTWIDALVSAFAIAGLSLPVFWLGLLGIWYFAVELRLLPAGGAESWQALILPVIVLGTRPAATISRLVAASLTEVLGKEFVRTARAKGLSERKVIYGHALRNALIATITVVGVQFGALLSGAVVTESVFAFPGVGRLLVDAIAFRDYPTIQYCILVLSVFFIAINLLVDLAYGWLDPRIQYT